MSSTESHGSTLPPPQLQQQQLQQEQEQQQQQQGVKDAYVSLGIKTEAEVSAYLARHGFQKYVASFAKENIDGEALIRLYMPCGLLLLLLLLLLLIIIYAQSGR